MDAEQRQNLGEERTKPTDGGVAGMWEELVVILEDGGQTKAVLVRLLCCCDNKLTKANLGKARICFIL